MSRHSLLRCWTMVQPWLLVAAALTPAHALSLSPVRSTPVSAMARTGHPLGNLSKYRAITSDTLHFAKADKLGVARARIKDLETAWDEAEPSLRPKDARAWKTIDTAIDRALAALRAPNPSMPTCVAALRDLLKTIDAHGR